MSDNNSLDLRGRSAVVTGGARGIGAATAHALAKTGVGVVVADILDADGRATAAEIGSGAAYHRLDVTDEEQWRRALDDAEAEFGPLAVLINNAGVLASGAIDTQAPALFRHVLEVNLVGAWLGMHVAAPPAARRGRRRHRQRLLHRGIAGVSRHRRVRRVQMGPARADQIGRAGTRGGGHPGVLGAPRAHPHADDGRLRPGYRRGTAASAFRGARGGGRHDPVRRHRGDVLDGSEFVLDGGATAGQQLTL